MSAEHLWTPCSTALPPEDVVVETKIDDHAGIRNVQPLKHRRRLWWFADDSMYVYYSPTHWRERREENDD